MKWMWGGALLAMSLGGCAHEQASTEATAMPVAENQPAQEAVRQPVAGHDEGLVLKPKGQYTVKQGELRSEQGEYFRPQGIYGTKGKITSQSDVLQNRQFGTYEKPEGMITQPKGLEVRPEGTFYRPFGGAMSERQPVAGHDTAYLFVRGPSGKTWQLSDPAIIKRVEQKLSEQGCNPGNIDGRADEQFAQGLMACQQKNGLQATGVIDQATAQKLGIDFESLRMHHELQPQQR